MFFDKCEKKAIDGTTYEITNGTQVEIWNCKQNLIDIYNAVDPGMADITFNVDSYQTGKKDLIKMLKEFDKNYTKHIKSGYVEMNAIHTAAMKPLMDMLTSNFNMNALEQLELKDKELPVFRREALVEKFCQHLTRLCEIFRDFGNLKDPFNIKQMLSVLQTPGWKEVTPLAFYLSPLENAIFETRECMLQMYKRGPLFCNYVVEDNEELQKKTIEMISKDVTAQWLAGDDLKQDQFKFIYNTMRVMYMSALKELLLAEDPKLLEEILPNLVVFRAIKEGTIILQKKKVDQKREAEKAEREGRKAGASLNVTQVTMAAPVEAETTKAGAGAKGKSTSKSPARGGSPTKGTEK
jgi:uncharacterized coiled-coil protein SlyX